MPDPHSPTPESDEPGDDGLADRVRPYLGRLGDAALPARSFDDLTLPGTRPVTISIACRWKCR